MGYYQKNSVNYRLTTPCRGCPFRKEAAPGWLGDYDAAEIVEHLRHEIPFLCHVQIEEGPGYDDPNWREWAEENADHCAGALIMQRKMAKLPRDPEHAAAVRRVDPQTPILFPPDAFIAHHNK